MVYLIPRPLFTKSYWDAPRAWRGQPHLPSVLSWETPSSASPELAYLGLFDLIVKQEGWQAESSLMLRVGEVELASVERLNNCINIAGSLRTNAYTVESRAGVEVP